MSGPERNTLYYVLGEFPSKTEYFVLQEIRGMQERGFDLCLFVLRRDIDTAGVLKAGEFDGRLVYDPPWFSLPKLAAVMGLFFRKSAKVLRWIQGEWNIKGQSFRQRLAIFKHLHSAAFFISQIRHPSPIWLHAHFANAPSRVARCIAHFTGSQYSLTAHANDIYVPASHFEANLRSASGIVTCTSANKAHLADLFPFIAGRLHRVYHGIDLESWPFQAASAPSGKVKLLGVGRMVEKKGFQHLVPALKLLDEKGFGFECRLIGEGPLLPALKDLVKEHGLSERIEFVGHLPQAAVRNALREADIFVLPCLVASDGDRDGLPNVVVEAMASGTPVISTAISAIGEVITDGETGLFAAEGDPVDIARQIESLAGDGGLFRRLSEQGRKRIEAQLSIRACNDQLAGLLQKWMEGAE